MNDQQPKQMSPKKRLIYLNIGRFGVVFGILVFAFFLFLLINPIGFLKLFNQDDPNWQSAMEALELHERAMGNPDQPIILEDRCVVTRASHIAQVPDDTIRLETYFLGDEDLKGLERLTLLEIVSFEQPKRITNKSIERISALPKIKTLYLTDCSLLDDNCLVHLQQSKSLQGMDIGSTGISDDGLAVIASWPGMKFVSLFEGTHFTDAGIEHLSRSTSIAQITLNFCSGLTDKSLTHLAKMKQLEVLSCFECPGFSQEALWELEEALPDCWVNYGE